MRDVVLPYNHPIILYKLGIVAGYIEVKNLINVVF